MFGKVSQHTSLILRFPPRLCLRYVDLLYGIRPCVARDNGDKLVASDGSPYFDAKPRAGAAAKGLVGFLKAFRMTVSLCIVQTRLCCSIDIRSQLGHGDHSSRRQICET